MKNYKVTFNDDVVLYFYGVTLRKRMVGEGSLKGLFQPFEVVEFLKGSKLIAEFYPNKYFTFVIKEISA